MYRSGLTATVIAKLCDVPVDRVVRVLAWSKRRDPTLAAQHTDHVPFQPPVIPVKWCERHQELMEFISSNGRMPYIQVSDHVEASLGRWLARQRYALLKGKLDHERKARLDDAGDWSRSARVQRDMANWHGRLNALAAFMTTSDRWPSYRNFTDSTERQLGVWLHAQRQNALNGRMTDEMVAAINTAVPGWNTWRPKGSGKPRTADASL
ncbi:helicase associated domain-containing protein [Arthrobacter oryzae]|uniref:helicase associated domain-containing protein n=1 Tax=Arthrobacter oryzae TaxID=409290 RepID=UPI00285A09D4|nr:hypothetical protein [Arthrobacter oryzae]